MISEAGPEVLVAAAAGGAVVLLLLWKLLRRRRPQPWMEEAACPACGWKGRTSRYAGRCPRCNTPIGEQKGARGR